MGIILALLRPHTRILKINGSANRTTVITHVCTCKNHPINYRRKVSTLLPRWSPCAANTNKFDPDDLPGRMRSRTHLPTLEDAPPKLYANNITQNQSVFLQRKTINPSRASEIVKTISFDENSYHETRRVSKQNQCFCDVNMSERKILLFIFFVIIYCFYNVQMWFLKRNEQKAVVSDTTPEIYETKLPEIITKSIRQEVNKVIPIKDATCGVVDIFTKKLPVKKIHPEMNAGNNALTVIGITVFLIILVLNAALDVLKVKEEERARRKLNPDGERRQSLAEFANKKSLRRESSKFGLQLFQIAESLVSFEDNKNNRRQSRPVTRGESTNSYLSEKQAQGESSPPSVGEVGEPKLVKRQSVAKLFGMFMSKSILK